VIKQLLVDDRNWFILAMLLQNLKMSIMGIFFLRKN